jgi:hypothetical protein
MLEHRKIRQQDDFFLKLSGRTEKCVYFYRINSFSEQTENFIRRFYETARMCGVVIEGGIPNPDNSNLAYYSEIMGNNFQMSVGFISDSLAKWLPRMNLTQRRAISESLYDTLDTMRKSGKNENMLKNAYIKFMCWMYYKFERIAAKLGEDTIPKILYEGKISKYELMLITILCGAGCDVVLLQYGGDADYLRLDPKSELSDVMEIPDGKPFPQGFCLKSIRDNIRTAQETEQLYGERSQYQPCTNAWISGKGLQDILTPVCNRGNDTKFFYNCYCRINGAEDRLTYQSELLSFYSEIKTTGRKTVIVDDSIPSPQPEEINRVKRRNYATKEQLITDMASCLSFITDVQLRRIARKSFVDVMLKQSSAEGENLNRLTSKAVFLICWLERYSGQLFKNWKYPETACFIMFGGCKKTVEALFLKLLSGMPVDILILKPDLNSQCVLEDSRLYEIHFTESLAISHFPQERTGLHIGTAAYQAERDLDTMLYTDSGIYRDKQHSTATSVVLSTMYEEIAILWEQELKFRPNFRADGDNVTMPVIFAKISGVKDRSSVKYWQTVKTLITPDTFVIRKAPFIKAGAANPVTPYAAEFFKNGKLQREKIMSHKCYRYGVLREDIQNHILDKLQLLIDSRIIKGTFQNGMEYTIIANILNMDKEIIRMLQRFDFTKKNPKIVYINTGETNISPEDTILTSFLSLAGFDVVFFVPTGYRSVEGYFATGLPDEHQIGDYLYDLRVPDFNVVPSNTSTSWRNIFKRGR